MVGARLPCAGPVIHRKKREGPFRLRVARAIWFKHLAPGGLNSPIGTGVAAFSHTAIRESMSAGGCHVDYANDNHAPEVERYRGSLALAALALLVSCALWLIIGLAAWRALGGWL